MIDNITKGEKKNAHLPRTLYIYQLRLSFIDWCSCYGFSLFLPLCSSFTCLLSVPLPSFAYMIISLQISIVEGTNAFIDFNRSIKFVISLKKFKINVYTIFLSTFMISEFTCWIEDMRELEREREGGRTPRTQISYHKTSPFIQSHIGFTSTVL